MAQIGTRSACVLGSSGFDCCVLGHIDMDFEACEVGMSDMENTIDLASARILGLVERVNELLDEKAQLQEQLTAERKRREEAEEQLEFDRTTCHTFIRALDIAIDGRFWLTEGRGSYAWDDDRYRDEFRDAAIELRAILTPMRGMAQNLASRLPTTEAVMKARVDLKARADKAEAELAYFDEHAREFSHCLGGYNEPGSWLWTDGKDVHEFGTLRDAIERAMRKP